MSNYCPCLVTEIVTLFRLRAPLKNNEVILVGISGDPPDGKLPDGKQKKLDPNSTYAPAWCDPSVAVEQALAESIALKSAVAENKAKGILLKVPESEESALSYGQKLVSLLFTCGASVIDIAFELGITAEEISHFENNRLIEEQTRIYRERFFSSDPQAQLKELLPYSVEYLKDMLKDKDNKDPKKFAAVLWHIEKVTGKAAQQIDVSTSLNFSHLLDEMKRMRETRDAIAQGALHSPSGSHKLIDVTPGTALVPDKYASWVDDWQKRRQNEKSK